MLTSRKAGSLQRDRLLEKSRADDGMAKVSIFFGADTWSEIGILCGVGSAAVDKAMLGL
jgi:hypothetical protein